VDPITEGFLSLSNVSAEQHSRDYPTTGGFMGFADVLVEQDLCEDPIVGGSMDLSDVPTEHDLCKDPLTDVVPPDLYIFRGASSKCAESEGVTEGVNTAANLPLQESRNVSSTV
jgi:hypothetical protein